MATVDAIRGKIQHEHRAKQIIDFSGLRFKNMTPTDMDGLIDFYDQAWVGFETKLEDAEMPFGQRLAFERATDDWQKAGKVSIFIVASHDQNDPDKPICAASTIVREYRYFGKWYFPKKAMTTKELIDEFLKKHQIGTSNNSNLPF